MSKKKTKQPKTRIEPTPRKQPKVALRPETDTNRVLWSFELFDYYEEWSDGCKRKDEFCLIARHMKDYERRTWQEIISSSKRDHPIPFDNLSVEAQKRLEILQLDDIDQLWRFRFDGEQRIWGIKQGHLFRVIWWDPEHKVCPAPKKHT